MAEFFNVRPPKQALEALLPHVSPVAGTETAATADALGRVTAADILSPEDLPAFARSAMDGFSVRARDTFGASEGMPALLEVVADIPTGQDSDARIGVGEAAVAYTGGLLAHGADAVVMIERTQPADDTSIEVLRPVAPGENVIQVGEDVRAGDTILRAGHRLRAQDIGGLLALGIPNLEVRRKPVVAVVSTGDELVAPSETPGRGMIRDINTYTVAARIAELGATAHIAGIAPDEYEPQLTAARAGLDAADALVFSAGSSLSARDMTAAVFNALGEPGVLGSRHLDKAGQADGHRSGGRQAYLRTAGQPGVRARGVRLDSRADDTRAVRRFGNPLHRRRIRHADGGYSIGIGTRRLRRRLADADG